MSFVPGSILSHDTRVTFRKLKEVVSGRTQESIESDIAYISTLKRVRSISAVTSILERFLEEELKQNKSSWNDLECCWEVVQLAMEEMARTDKRSGPEIRSDRQIVEDERVQEFEKPLKFQNNQETDEETWKGSYPDTNYPSRDSSTEGLEAENEFSSSPDTKVFNPDSTLTYSEHTQCISPRLIPTKSSTYSNSLNNSGRVLPNDATGSVSSNEPSNGFSRSKSSFKEFTELESARDNIIYHNEAFQLRVAAAVSSFRKARLNLFNSDNRISNTVSNYLPRQEMLQKSIKNNSFSSEDLNLSNDKNINKIHRNVKEESHWLPSPPSYKEACKGTDAKELSAKLSFDNHLQRAITLHHRGHSEPVQSPVTVAFRDPHDFLSYGESSAYSDTENILLLLRQLREAFEILNVLHKKREKLRLHWEDREHRWKKLSSRLQQNPSKGELEKGKRWEEKAGRAKRDLEYVTRKIYAIVEQIETFHVPVFTAALCEILRIHMTISDAVSVAMKSLRPFLQEEYLTMKRLKTSSACIDERNSVVNRTQELVLSRHSSNLDPADESKTEISFYRSVSPIVSPRGLEFESSSKNEVQSSVVNREKELTLNNIPEEILAQVFKYLSIQERAVVAQVCKAFYGACNRGELWRKVVLQGRFPSDLEPGSKLSTATLLESFFRLHGKHVRRVEYFQACSRFAGSVPLQLVAQHCMHLEELILNDTPPGSVTDELLLDIFCKAGFSLRTVELNYCNLVSDASLKSLAAFCPRLERFIARSDSSFGKSKEISTNMTSSGIQAIVAHCEQLKEICVPVILCERNLSLLAERCHYLTTVHVEDPPSFRRSSSVSNSLADGVSKENDSGNNSDYATPPRSETWHKLLERFPDLKFTLNVEIDLTETLSVNSPHHERRRVQSNWTCEDFVKTFGNRVTAITDLSIYFVCVRDRVTFRGLGKLFSCLANGFPRLKELRVENLESFPLDGCSQSSLGVINEGLVEIVTNCKLLSEVSLGNFPFASHVLFYLLKMKGMQLTTLSLGLRDVYEHPGSLVSKCSVEESKMPSILLAIGQFAPFVKQLCITDSEHLSRVILKNIMAKLKSLEKLIISNCRRVKQEDIDEISKRYFWVNISYVG